MRTPAPYASAHLLGLGDTAPTGAVYPDQSFDIPFNATLTASAAFQLTQQIDRDAIFIWRALIINSAAVTSLLFTVQFNINGWYNLSNGQVIAANLQSDASSPYPIWPELPVPAGGYIGINGTETSGSTNTIQIVFRGIKRFVQQ